MTGHRPSLRSESRIAPLFNITSFIRKSLKNQILIFTFIILKIVQVLSFPTLYLVILYDLGTRKHF